MGVMRSFFKKIEYLIDIYVVYFMYSPNKKHRYYSYMKRKWRGLE